jgi:acetyl esterase/lipase
MKKLTFLFFVATVVPNLSALADEIEIAKDITYLEDVNYPDNKDKLDLYIPAGDGPHPVLIFIHGGGLLRGSKVR